MEFSSILTWQDTTASTGPSLVTGDLASVEDLAFEAAAGVSWFESQAAAKSEISGLKVSNYTCFLCTANQISIASQDFSIASLEVGAIQGYNADIDFAVQNAYSSQSAQTEIRAHLLYVSHVNLAATDGSSTILQDLTMTGHVGLSLLFISYKASAASRWDYLQAADIDFSTYTLSASANGGLLRLTAPPSSPHLLSFSSNSHALTIASLSQKSNLVTGGALFRFKNINEISLDALDVNLEDLDLYDVRVTTGTAIYITDDSDNGVTLQLTNSHFFRETFTDQDLRTFSVYDYTDINSDIYYGGVLFASSDYFITLYTENCIFEKIQD